MIGKLQACTVLLAFKWVLYILIISRMMEDTDDLISIACSLNSIGVIEACHLSMPYSIYHSSLIFLINLSFIQIHHLSSSTQTLRFQKWPSSLISACWWVDRTIERAWLVLSSHSSPHLRSAASPSLYSASPHLRSSCSFLRSLQKLHLIWDPVAINGNPISRAEWPSWSHPADLSRFPLRITPAALQPAPCAWRCRENSPSAFANRICACTQDSHNEVAAGSWSFRLAELRQKPSSTPACIQGSIRDLVARFNSWIINLVSK